MRATRVHAFHQRKGLLEQLHFAPCFFVFRPKDNQTARVPGAGALFGQDEAARGEIRLGTTRSASNQNYEACPRGK